jgi:hypothetical protein
MGKSPIAVSVLLLLSILGSCRDNPSPTVPELPSSTAELPEKSSPSDLLLSLSAEDRATLDYEYARIATEEVQGFAVTS